MDLEERIAAREKTISLLDEQFRLLNELSDLTSAIGNSHTRTLRNLHDRLYNLEEWQQYMFPDGGRQ